MRIDLTAWAEQVEDLPAEVATALTQSGMVDVRVAEPPSRWRLVTDSRIGVLIVANWDVRVKPMLTVPRLMFLLGYAADPRGWRELGPLFDVEDDLFSAIAHGFSLQAERALSPAPLRGYVAVDERELTLRGRVRIGDQLARQPGLPIPLELTYDDHTADVPENRLVRGAAELLLRMPQPHTGRVARAAARQPLCRGDKPVAVSLTVAVAGERYQHHLRRAGRKRSTVAAVESALRVHLEPFFAGRTLDAICHDDVVDLVAVLERRGLGPKSIRNYVGTLSALFNHARAPQRRWAAVNPCEGVELPGIRESGEIRFLDEAEWEAVLRHVQTGGDGSIDRAFYLTAIMAGLRHGELIALRWRDVDWVAGRIRVRQNWVLGEFDTPKSRRGSRSVPMADRLAGELDRLHTAKGEPGEDALVFADPITGGPLDKAANLRRYRKVLKAAALDTTHNLHGLRHTFGTRMAAAGVPMRVRQEWMGHRNIATTERYADYAPSQHESALIERAWAPSGSQGPVLSESHITSHDATDAVEPDHD